MHLLTKSEQEAFLQVKLASAVLLQGFYTKHDIGFRHFGEWQSTSLNIYATTELCNTHIRHLLEKIQSTHTEAWGANSYPCASILLLPYIFIRHRCTWNNKHAGELKSIQASAYIVSTVLD